MSTIATLAVALTANSAAFESGFGRGSKSLESFSASASAAASSLGGLFAIFGGGASLAGLTAWIASSTEAVESSARMADSLGLTTTEMGRLDYAARVTGASTESLSAAMAKMERAIGEVATGGGPQIAAALQRIGLNAKTLANESPAKAFADISEALKRTNNSYERAQDAQEIFGRGFRELVPLLRLGKDGLAQLGEEADRSGNALSEVQSEKVILAMESVRKLELAFEGVGKALAVAVMPYVEAAVDRLNAFSNSGEAVRSKVGGAVEFVAKGIGYAADILQVFQAGWKYLQAAAAVAAAGIVTILEGISKAIDYVLEKLGKAHTGMTEFFDAQRKGLLDDAHNFADAADAALMAKPASAGIADFFAKAKENAEAAAKAAVEAKPAFKGFGDLEPKGGKSADQSSNQIEELIGRLQEQADTLGMTKTQIDLYKAAVLGANESDMSRIKALGSVIEAAEKQKKIMEEGVKITESVQSPAQKYRAEVDKLDDALNASAITWETYQRAIKKAHDEMDSATKGSFVNTSSRFKVFGGDKAAGEDAMSRMFGPDKTAKDFGIFAGDSGSQAAQAGKGGMFGPGATLSGKFQITKDAGQAEANKKLEEVSRVLLESNAFLKSLAQDGVGLN